MAMLKFDENKVPYIDLGKDYCVRLENDEFTDAKSKEKAARELRETPDVVAEALKELRAKLQGQYWSWCWWRRRHALTTVTARESNDATRGDAAAATENWFFTLGVYRVYMLNIYAPSRAAGAERMGSERKGDR